MSGLAKPIQIGELQTTIPNECMKIKFDDGCIFYIASTANLTILGEQAGQVVKFICPHGDDVSFFLDQLPEELN